MKHLRFAFSALVTTALALSGCGEEGVSQYRAPKPQAPPPLPSAGHTRPAAHDHAHSHGEDDLKYKLPEGWKSVGAGTFLMAAFEVDPAHPQVRCTVSKLGGGLLPNINRWRQQVGLGEISEQDLVNEAVPVTIDDHPGLVVDLQGETQRTLGAIVPEGDQAWFFKLMGPVEVIAAQKDNFHAFLKTVKLHGGDHD